MKTLLTPTTIAVSIGDSSGSRPSGPQCSEDANRGLAQEVGPELREARCSRPLDRRPRRSRRRSSPAHDPTAGAQPPGRSTAPERARRTPRCQLESGEAVLHGTSRPSPGPLRARPRRRCPGEVSRHPDTGPENASGATQMPVRWGSEARASGKRCRTNAHCCRPREHTLINLHVLLRHRPRSIPQAQESA